MRNTTVPIPTVSAPDYQAEPSAERCSCGKCGKTFAGGAIVSHPPRIDQLAGKPINWVRVRVIYCDHCHHLMHWLEALNGMMEPTSVILHGPKYIRSEQKIREFLSRYPQAAGVEQV